MKDKIRNVFILLLNAIHAGKIYVEEHPSYQEFIAKLFAQLQEILAQHREIILGVVDGELAWENEIFFDLSHKPGSLRGFLEDNRIERIIFQQGLKVDELSRFIAIVSRMKKNESSNPMDECAVESIQSIRIGRLRTIGSPVEPPQAPDLAQQYEESVWSVKQSLDRVLNREEINSLDLRIGILNIMENFMGRHQELLNLISIKEKDAQTYIHLLNVSLLSMFIASRLKFFRNDVLDIGVAALFHDIGLLSISSEILHKKEKLDHRELEQRRDHPVLGAKLLYDLRETLGPLTIVVAFEHHLCDDLTGYPKVRFPQKPHLGSQIVSLCDVYDTLSLRRSPEEDYPPDKIYKKINADRGKVFDAQLIDRFFEAMGVWPVGTIVLLNDYRVAVVRQAEAKDIFRPTVEVIAPAKCREVIALIDRPDLSISEALNPQKNGKPYLHLI